MPFVTRSARGVTALLACLAGGIPAMAALGERPIVSFEPSPGGFPMADSGQTAPLLVDPEDWAGVVRVVQDLQLDEERVCGARPAIRRQVGRDPSLVIVGTLGKSGFVDKLVREGRIDDSGIRGKWESWLTRVVEHPFPGVERALVVAGSDKRGTIYGVYNLSEQMGVSPWYWWADVPPARHARIFVEPEPDVHGPPVVKYRGIFLNDEAPELTRWIREKYGEAPASRNPPVPPDTANYGHEFYARIFEVLLRLRANYLWPAMWGNAFNEDDPANPALADAYGIVMGTSHQEPMLRAQKEWDRRYGTSLGHWNYAKQPDVLQDFWREGVRRNRRFESIYTLGLRGANDTEMAPGGPAANRTMLEGIVQTQRDILRQEVDPDLSRVPQVWCLYKEVQAYYESGMRVPDDVTLLWADDNWGNLRRLPKPEERSRPGGAGIYYHMDYVGDPRNYKWIDTNPLPKIWDQLSLAADYGADRLWIVNVGHFKGYERPMEFFLRLAWKPSRWGPDAADEFTRLWAEREFGKEHAAEIAGLAERLSRLNGRRKPELLKPGTYSLVNYREAERVLEEYASLTAEARSLQARLHSDQRDAFYQTVAFPAAATSIVNALYICAGKNALYARQGRASASAMAEAARSLFQEDRELMKFYNTGFAQGRWAHFMDQPHIGYTGWNDPPEDNLGPLNLVTPSAPHGAKLGVAIEGSTEAWPGTTQAAMLPRFDSINRQRQYIEVFKRGDVPFDYKIQASDPWILVSATGGTAGGADQRHLVGIDWGIAPEGLSRGSIRVSGANESVEVGLEIVKDSEVTRENLRGFAEDRGEVSIEAEHFSVNTAGRNSQWTRVAGYGRTLSGLRAEAPIDAPMAVPGADAACLEYPIYLFTSGPVTVEAITGPTLNFRPGKALRYAAAIDNETPQVVTVVPSDFSLPADRPEWESVVSDNARTVHSEHPVARSGYHTLRIWAVDPGVVLEKLIVNAGGLRPSYLGPPESFRGEKHANP